MSKAIDRLKESMSFLEDPLLKDTYLFLHSYEASQLPFETNVEEVKKAIVAWGFASSGDLNALAEFVHADGLN